MGTSINNKCKAFTSLEQSKRLAEILPLEGADMYYREVSFSFYKVEAEIPRGWYGLPPKGYYCWSLAALLNVLPYPSLHKTFCGWRCDSYNKEGNTCMLGKSADNQIDACYEMILKLNEQKLL